MTKHIFYDHKCPKCNTYYVPYDKDVPCPKCGNVEQERFDFIPKAVESIKFNLENYGKYFSRGWLVSSFSDHVLLILFEMFESYRIAEEKSHFIMFAKGFVSVMEYEYQKFYQSYYYKIAIRAYEELYGQAVWAEEFRGI